MRARLGLLPALALLLCAALLAPASVLAATSEQVAASATASWKQTCLVNTGNITCTGPASRVHIWLGGSMWTLAAAVVAWLGLGWVRSLGVAQDGFGVTLLSTAFAAILVAGLEAAAFGLMPLRFMPGHAVYRWNRLGWALLFGLSVFAFVHLLIGPTSGHVSELSPGAFMAALDVFGAFGLLSIATWAFFRFRPKPEPAGEAA